MTIINSYATLADFKIYGSSRGTTASTDTNDDLAVEDILEAVSRYFDTQTGRTYYPRYETRYFSVPDGRTLYLDDDLLALVSIANGDDSAIPTTEVYLRPRNASPSYAITINESSSYYWTYSSQTGMEFVIDIVGWWGYHDFYTQRGWKSGGTLAAAITDAAATTFTMTAGHSLVAGQIIKVDSELMIVSSVSTNTITPLARGDNGSTAATHVISSVVYVWQPMDLIKTCCLSTAFNIWKSRQGQYTAGNIAITASGVVINPQDVSPLTNQILNNLTRKL